MKTRSFAGAGTALVTPFTRDGALDEAALRRMVKRQVDEGIDVLVPCGTTGEAATMTNAEQDRVIAITVEVAAGKVPVVGGAGSNDTHKAVERTREVCALGVDGILSVGPYYNKPTPDGFVAHFNAVAEASSRPIVVYNVPGRTGSNIDAKTMLRIAQHRNVAAVKEASGNLAQVMDILRDKPQGFQVLSGDDALALPLMALGAEGVISVVSNQVPGPMHQLAAACQRGDYAEARRIHNRLLPLMNVNFVESNPVPVKAGMALLGLCEENYRLPMCPPRDATREALRAVLRDLEMLPRVTALERWPDLPARIDAFYALPAESLGDEARAAFDALREGLEAGEIRAAEPRAEGWAVNHWVKRGILLGFRMGAVVEMAPAGCLHFFDKDTFPPQPLTVERGVRVVPGGSAVRAGAHVGRGVVIMPPAYVNVGAYVGEGSMIDSHALVGSCAQVGKRCHISAAAQLGGVLEPVGAMPVIVEDEVLVGGNCGVYEGTIVGRRAVLGTGVLLTGSVTVYDVPRKTTYRRQGDQPLRIPEGAVVVPGSRRVSDPFAEKHGLSLYTPVIVKYRDDKTDAAAALEEALR